MMRRLRKGVAVALVVAGAAVVVTTPVADAHASACTRSWAAPVDGAFSDPTKWSPPGVPTATDAVCIDRPGVYLVSVHGTFAMASFTVGASSGMQRVILEAECVHGNAYLDTPVVDLGANAVTTLTARGCGWSGIGNWHSSGTNAGSLLIARGEYPSRRYVPSTLVSTGRILIQADVTMESHAELFEGWVEIPGSLTLQVASPTVASRINTWAGAAFLTGTVEVLPVRGFVPELGMAWDVVWADTVVVDAHEYRTRIRGTSRYFAFPQWIGDQMMEVREGRVCSPPCR